MTSKTKLEKLYKQFSVKQVAEKLKISRNKVYELLSLYEIPLHQTKSDFDKWVDKVGLPENDEEYLEKYKHEKGRPLDKWFLSDLEEDYYCEMKEPTAINSN